MIAAQLRPVQQPVLRREVAPYRFEIPELAHFGPADKRQQVQQFFFKIVLDGEAGITVAEIFETVHEIEGLLAVIPDLVARMQLQEHEGQSIAEDLTRIGPVADLPPTGYAEILGH